MKRLLPLIVVLALISLFFVWFIGHSGYFPFSHNPMQYMPNMYRTKALVPQREYPFFADGASVRVPPEGAVAQKISVYPYKKETLAADVKRFSNPQVVSKDHLLRGQKLFDTYCIVCHGPAGYGNGLVVPPFPQPPSLQSDKIRNYADSQIFHVMTVGQNSMGAYGPQIREEDRWSIVHYIRVLQKSENPSEADLKAFELMKTEQK